MLQDPACSSTNESVFIVKRGENEIADKSLHLILERFFLHQSIGHAANNVENSVLLTGTTALTEFGHAEIDSRLQHLFSLRASSVKDLGGGSVRTDEIFENIKL